jgi:hypothetical protein
MAIASLSKVVSDYIKGFDLVALAADRDGRIGATRDPAGAARAWWCQSASAGMVLKAARRNGDIEAAARTLGVELADHAAVLARAEAAVVKIGARLDQAQKTGVLHTFNAEFRRRRLAAFEKGKGFMSYREARSRLQRVLAGVAATGTAPEAFVKTVFDGEGG